MKKVTRIESHYHKIDGSTTYFIGSTFEQFWKAADAGAKRILIPVADMMQYSKVPSDLISKFSLEVYSDPVDAAFKALGIK